MVVGQDLRPPAGHRAGEALELGDVREPAVQVEVGEPTAGVGGGVDAAQLFLGDPGAGDLRMLPNPFSPRGRGRFRELGGSLRYAYVLP